MPAAQPFVERAREQDRRAAVDGPRLVERREVEAREMVLPEDRRIVDEYVEAPEARVHLVDQRGDLRGIRQVGLQRNRIVPAFGDRTGRRCAASADRS